MQEIFTMLQKTAAQKNIFF